VRQLFLALIACACLAVLVLTAVAGWRADPDADVRAYQSGSAHLPMTAESVTVGTPRGQRALKLADDGASAVLPAELTQGSVLTIVPKDHTQAAITWRVGIVDRRVGYFAAASAWGFFLTLVAVFGAPPGEVSGQALRRSLSEPGGGMSLGRIQLLVWFLPALGILSALSLPLLATPDVPSSLGVLFGLSGLTTTLGAAASPNVKNAALPTTLTVSQALEGWQDGLDFSRVQYFALSLIGALALIANFVATMRCPDIPQGLLMLVGASQATYLGNKAVKRDPDVKQPAA
jgi:hypothetical protein